MPKTREATPLVAAAAELESELDAFAELATEARRVRLDSDKALTRTARVLESSVERQAAIEGKLHALVEQIEAVRARQQATMETLLEVTRELDARHKQRKGLLARFTALGESATHANELTLELGKRKAEGAPDQELLERLAEIQVQMAGVVAEAEALAVAAERDGWPDIARQADGVKQQLHAAKNKLAIAQRDLAARAPS
jgi:hypothetical protein